MKKCCQCKETKEDSEFNKNASRKDGLQGHCRVCAKIRYKRYYRETPKEKERVLRNKKLFKVETLAWLTELKSKPCSDCGRTYHPCQMDFDHLRDKEFTISKIIHNRTRDVVLSELAKCELVCANCHRLRTHERLQPDVDTQLDMV